jgi:hypothetical protein
MSAADPRRSGTVVGVGGARWFLPSHVALRVARLPTLTPVPGAPVELLGVAHVEGEIVPILAPRPNVTVGRAVICEQMGERVGVAVDEILHAGVVEADPNLAGGVRFEGRSVPTLDVAGLCSRVQRAAWRSSG